MKPLQQAQKEGKELIHRALDGDSHCFEDMNDLVELLCPKEGTALEKVTKWLTKNPKGTMCETMRNDTSFVIVIKKK